MTVAKKSSVKKTASKKTAKKKAVKKTSAKPLATKKRIATKSPKRSVGSTDRSLDIRNRLSLMVLSSYRFPIDPERLAIQSARLAGLAFVFIGAFLTMMNLPVVHDELVKISASQLQYASLPMVQSTESAKIEMAGEWPDTSVFTDSTDYDTKASLSDGGVIPFVIEISTDSELQNVVDIYVQLTGSSYVEIYAEPKLSTVPRLLGVASKVGHDSWIYQWNTWNTPNGEYRVFAVGNVSGNKVTSDYTSARVANHVKKDSIAEIDTASIKSLSAEYHRIKDIVSQVNEDSDVTESADDSQPVLGEKGSEEVNSFVKNLLEVYKVDINNETERLISVLRSGNQDQIEKVHSRFDELRKKIIESSIELEPDEYIAFVNSQLNIEFTAIESKIIEVEKVISKKVGKEALKDSDSDGITDFDELVTYGTNPNLADTDGDGFLDGAEILSGFNPLNASAETVLEYESPRESGLIRNDMLSILSLESRESTEQMGDKITKQVVLIKGTALPNSFATLYVFSAPTLVTVKADNEGNWSYVFNKTLEEGEHEMYLGVTDNAGKIMATSKPFKFIRTADSFTPVAGTKNINFFAEESASAQNFLSGNMMLLLSSVTIIVIGLVLLLLGMLLNTRREFDLKRSLATAK